MIERKTKRAQDLVRGDKIILGLSVYIVGNTQHYWGGHVKVNLTDMAGWTSNRFISGEIKIA
jgi:hypothetical protein